MDKRLTDQAELQAQSNSQEDNSSNKVSGYALLFNTLSKDLGGFAEQIDPKALDNVDLSKVVMLDQHDYSKPLASVAAGTLELSVDDKGLKFTATLDPEVSYAKDTLNNVKNGNINSMSYRFDLDDGADSWERDTEGNVIRTINQVKDLFEVSTVTVPAYDDTNVQVEKRSYEEFINTEKEGQEMEKELKTQMKHSATEDFEQFVRSYGQTRDGLTTKGAAAVIPQEVVTPVLELKNSNYNLAQYATVKTVSTGTGSYPIATRYNTAVLATKEELADIPDVDANMFKDVAFNAVTRAGKIPLSNELVEDSVVDIVGEVKKQLQKLVDNTDNAGILQVVTGTNPLTKATTDSKFKKEKASTVDDLKRIFNVELDPALNKMWFVNQTAFNYLDTLKDNEGRYLLQPNPAAESGFTLLGAPVVQISDAFLPNNSDGTSPVIVGDLAEAVAVFHRNQVTAQWDKFDQYAQGLSVVVRADYQPISDDAVINVSLGAAAK